MTDPSGKVVQHVTVTLTNPAQSTTRSFDTQADGSFSFTTLEAASYELTVAAPTGFASYRQTVNMNVGQDLNVPVQLQLASSQTKIEVLANTPTINTTTSALGGVINARQISTPPLNGRNYLELSLLVPGNAPAPNFDPTKENTVVISTAGQVGRGSNVTIDGADDNDDAVGGSLVNVPENAVQEFQIATNRFSAELGRSGSSVTNVITKQGTNALHGGVGVYVRDKALQGLPAPYDPSIGITPPFHPAFVRQMIDISSTLLFADGCLTRQQKEMISAYISKLNSCPYCLDSHGFFLLVHGAPKEVADKIIAGEIDDDVLSDEEHQLLLYVGKVNGESVKTTKENVQQLRGLGWQDEQIAEAVHVAAMMGLCYRVANAFGLPSQGFLDLQR